VTGPLRVPIRVPVSRMASTGMVLQGWRAEDESQPAGNHVKPNCSSLSSTMSDQAPARRFLLGWPSVSLVLLFLKAVVKYSQTIAATLTGVLWRSAYASRSVRPRTQTSCSSPSHSTTAPLNMPPPIPDFSAPPPRLVLDDFIAKALSSTPPDLHPFFEAFKSLYTRK
jgi:hypothetical protein